MHIARERAARHQPFWQPSWNDAVAAYTAVLATPDAQRMLAMPGDRAAQQAHQFGCLNAAEFDKPVTDLEIEIALFRWLTKRCGIEVPPDVNERVVGLRRERQQRPPRAAAS